MPTFKVHIVQTVSAVVEVEAETAEEAALEEFYNSEQMPSSISYGAFGTHARVDEAGQWEATSVELDGKEVWTGETPMEFGL